MNNVTTVYKNGSLEVYWLSHPELLYWFDSILCLSYGPFQTIDAAVTHYTKTYQTVNTKNVVIIKIQPINTEASAKTENVIEVDFTKRKRIVNP